MADGIAVRRSHLIDTVYTSVATMMTVGTGLIASDASRLSAAYAVGARKSSAHEQLCVEGEHP